MQWSFTFIFNARRWRWKTFQLAETEEWEELQLFFYDVCGQAFLV